MKTATALLALMAFAGVASARPVLVSGPVTEAVQAIVEGTPIGFAPTSVVRHYDNWTNPPSALTGVFLAGSDEIADDLAMTPVGAGLLSTMGVNCANANATSSVTGGQLAVRFYTGGGAYIGGFLANLPAVSLAAGGSVRLSFPAGSLLGMNIVLPQNIYVSLQWVSATFTGAGTLANLGFQTRGPVGIGSSTDLFTNVTTNSTFNFGGAPVANTGLFIDTEDSFATPTDAKTWGRLKALYR